MGVGRRIVSGNKNFVKLIITLSILVSKHRPF